MKSLIKKFKNRINPAKEKVPLTLTDTQKSFITWNAQRLNISTDESEKRYLNSWNALPEGHRGKEYRSFNDLSYKLFQVFSSDTGDEVYTAYQNHSQMHFLRMLSYYEPQWSPDNPIVEHLVKNFTSVTILDFGCGLAQRSRALAKYLKDEGIEVKLFLADIPTLRKDFLLWLGTQSGIETHFLDCTVSAPIPELPDCTICIATEFFEHVYDPLMYFNRIDSALQKYGLLVTNISDHHKEFMHVSPNLESLRNRIKELNYEVIAENQIFKKTS